MQSTSPEPIAEQHYLSSFRFSVLFLSSQGPPNPVDIRFQRVGGLSATVETSPRREGGQNLYTQKLPTGVTYEPLRLERGVVASSPLDVEIGTVFSRFEFNPTDVMLFLLDEQQNPKIAWLFFRAFPVRWSTADLDAQEPKILIDTLELAYAHRQRLAF